MALDTPFLCNIIAMPKRTTTSGKKVIIRATLSVLICTYEKIPRKFNRITGKMLINTSMDKIGDILHITKNDYGYLSLNTKTQKYAYCFVGMIRNKEIFELMEIV
jgi:hypothetical protein